MGEEERTIASEKGRRQRKGNDIKDDSQSNPGASSFASATYANFSLLN